MDEKMLDKLSIITAAIGILLLLLITEFHLPEDRTNAPITEEQEGEQIRMRGVIEEVKETPAIIILTIKSGNEKAKVIVFKDKEKIQIKKGDRIEVEGKVTEYKGQEEIEAESIRLF